MIKNPNDPTGLGLFSKCARSQAAKIKNNNPTTPSTRNRIFTRQLKIKHSSTDQFSFDKQESRDQRQRRYKKDETPSVGQYKTTIQSKSKMVWDILKTYKNAAKKANQRYQRGKGLLQDEQHLNEQMQQQLIQKQLISEVYFQGKQNPQQFPIINKQDSKDTILNKSQCLINMSRITGRKSVNYETYGSPFDYDVLNSINHIKRKITKNIDISKQDRIRIRKQRQLNPSCSYQYNYKVIKHQYRGLLDFSQSNGRKQSKRGGQQYSYQHYDYDSYVWNNNSRVFPNTKLNLIQFKKQSNRYKKIKQQSSQSK